MTGGNGYVAGFLIRRLSKLGCEVRALDLEPHRGDCAVESVVGDVRSFDDVRAACQDIDTVFHTVALINLLALYRAELRRTVFEVNVLGTEQVIRACRSEGVGRLVYTSTINVAMGEAVRDGRETARYVREGDLLDLYAETKSAAEQAVLAADAPGKLRTVSLRPGGIWGPWRPGGPFGPGEGAMMISAFVEQLALGRFKVLIGSGDAAIDNTHVENAIDAHLLAAQKLTETPEIVGGQAYFVTDGEPMNGIDWFRPLVEGLGHRWPTRRIPGWLMLRIAHLLELIHFLGGPEPTLTRRGVLNLIRDASFSIDKARSQLGYEPRIRSAEGLRAILPEVKALYDRFGSEK